MRLQTFTGGLGIPSGGLGIPSGGLAPVIAISSV